MSLTTLSYCPSGRGPKPKAGFDTAAWQQSVAERAGHVGSQSMRGSSLCKEPSKCQVSLSVLCVCSPYPLTTTGVASILLLLVVCGFDCCKARPMQDSGRPVDDTLQQTVQDWSGSASMAVASGVLARQMSLGGH
jgi:hypothetical protein